MSTTLISASTTSSPILGGFACLPLEVKVTANFWNVDPLWLGLGFLIGFIIGGLLALLFGKIYIPHLANYKARKDAEKGDMDKAEAVAAAKDKKQDDDDENKAKMRKRKKRKTKAMQSGTTVELLDLIEGEKGGEESEIKGVADALVKTNGDEINEELTSQDLDSFKDLEKDIKNEEITSFLMLMRSLLAQAMMKGGVSDKKCQEQLKNLTTAVIAAKQQAQQEKEDEEQELRNDPKLAKDPNALEKELQKLQPKYITRLDELMNETRDKFMKDLKEDLGFSDEDIDAMLNEHKRNMYELERKLGEESLRHSAILEEKLARRRLLSQVQSAEKEEERANVPVRRELYENVLQQLVDDSRMLERQKDDLLNQHQQNLQRIQDVHEEDRQRQELKLAEKLKKKREEQTRRLAEKQRKERAGFAQKADKAVGSGEELIDAYHDLVTQQRLEQEAMEEMLDNMDLEEMGKLQQEMRVQREKQMNKEDERFQETLEIKGQLSEQDVNRIIALHNQEKAEYNRTKSRQKKAAQMKLQERLAERKRKAEEDKQSTLAEQAALTAQQEASIKRVLETQLDLEDDAKKRILEEHEKSMAKVNAQLTMSQTRQHKELEQKLAARRAKVAKLREDAEQQAKSGNLKEKEAEKIQQQIQREEQDIERQRQQALAELRKRLADETQAALAEQEKEIGVMIAKLQVGAARRKDIIERQEKTIKDLEEQMAKKLENTEDVENQAVDYLLQQHHANIASVEQQMEQSKQRNERLIAEKLAQKKLRKEREIVEKIENEAVQEMEEQHQRGAGVASNLMLQVMMEQRHKRALEDLEKEMRIEMNRQRDEISRELQKELDVELQEQKKNFLAQLAAVSNLSKDDVNELVNTAVSETGGDEKQAKKLAKDLRIGLKRAKTDMGLDEEEERGLGRMRSSMGYDNSAYSENYDERALSSKLRRKPRKAFED